MYSVRMNNRSYFEITQGDDATVSLLVLDENGNPVDLTGYALTGRFRSTTGTAVVENIAASSPAQMGEAIMTIVAADSTNFQPGTRVDWELQMAKSGANKNVIVTRGVTIHPPTV